MKPASVADYIASQPKPAARALRQVQAVVRKAVREADPVISYGMPAFKLNGRILLYFAAWKEHYSVYPASDRFVQKVKAAAKHRVSRGTLRFDYEEAFPTRLMEQFIRFRVKELAERAAARKTKRAPSKRVS